MKWGGRRYRGHRQGRYILRSCFGTHPRNPNHSIVAFILDTRAIASGKNQTTLCLGCFVGAIASLEPLASTSAESSDSENPECRLAFPKIPEGRLAFPTRNYAGGCESLQLEKDVADLARFPRPSFATMDRLSTPNPYSRTTTSQKCVALTRRAHI